MNKPIFSIIVPTYNREKELDRCLKSLEKQTFKDFEVIVCDDGSTDKTKEVVDNYRSILSLVYSFEKNWGGPAVPRNRGIQLASGKWICFLDSDDWFKPDKLSVLKKTIDYNKADFFYHPLKDISDSNKRNPVLRTWALNSKNATVLLLTSFNAILTSSTCINTEKLKESNLFFKEDKDIIGIEDFDLWIRIAKSKNFRFCFLKQKLGYYWSGGGAHIGLKGASQANKVEKVYLDNLKDQPEQIIKLSKAALNYQKASLLMTDSAYTDKKAIRKLLYNSVISGVFKVKMMAIARLILLR